MDQIGADKFNSFLEKTEFKRKKARKDKLLIAKRIKENNSLKKRVSIEEKNITKVNYICNHYETCEDRCKHGYPHSKKADCGVICDDGTGRVIKCKRI